VIPTIDALACRGVKDYGTTERLVMTPALLAAENTTQRGINRLNQ